MRRRVVATLVWVAVLLALAPSPAAPVAPEGDDIEATAARLDDLQRRITGNAEELRATELLNHHRVEGAIAACMAAAGRPYRKAPFVSFYAGFTDAELGYGTGRASVIDSLTEGGRRLIANEIAFARLERAGAIDADRRVAPADVGVHNGCTARVGHRAAFDIDPPAGAHELSPDELIVPLIGGPATDMSGYRSCMKQRYGHDVADRSDFLFRPRIDRADAPVDGRPANAAWTRGVAGIEAAFAADADCRRPVYRIAMQHVAHGLDGWEQRHRADLDRIRAEWRQRVADAARLPR